jgi:hypothetical protein
MSNEQQGWWTSVEHLSERVKSELRMNAPAFFPYWTSNPDPLPPRFPFDTFGAAYVDLAIKQLHHVTQRLRAGHDSPLTPGDADWPHSRSQQSEPLSGEPTGELGQDRQVGVAPNPIQPANAEGEK